MNIFTINNKVKRSYKHKSRSITIRTFYNSSILLSTRPLSKRLANKINRYVIRSFNSCRPVYSPNKIGHARKILDLVGKHKPNLTLIPNNNPTAASSNIPPIAQDTLTGNSTIGLLNRIIPKPIYGSVIAKKDHLNSTPNTTTTLINNKDHQIGSEVLTRNYALRIRDFKNPDELQHAEDKSPVDLHLKKHSVVFNDISNTIEAVMTSCKKDSTYEFLNTVKIDGSSTGQHMKALSNPRGIDSKELKLPEKTNSEYPIHKYESWNEDRMHDIIERSGVREKEIRNLERKNKTKQNENNEDES